jgi:hypothetical protein
MTTKGNQEDSPSKAKKDTSAAETPSAIAAKEAGPLADDATDEEKVAWNEKYTAAHMKAQRG